MTAVHEARFDEFDSDAVSVARRLLGQRLVRSVDDTRLAGTIVDVEAYLGLEDRAAHTFNGRRTQRNESMYLPGGHAYVYMIYGIHHCLNIVCGRAGEGIAVLIRALEPMDGIDLMHTHRDPRKALRRPLRERDLCSGPGKLAQALRIDKSLDGECLRSSETLWIERGERVSEKAIARSARIGVDYAGEWASKPLRFFLRGNPHVSN